MLTCQGRKAQVELITLTMAQDYCLSHFLIAPGAINYTCAAPARTGLNVCDKERPVIIPNRNMVLSPTGHVVTFPLFPSPLALCNP